MHLLIADDEQELVRAIAAILQFHHYTVDTAHNGREAMELLQQRSYDGVVLDIMMPEISGLDVLQQLRRQNNLVPVLLLTAKTETEDRIVGLDYGADDYLGKPFSMGELLARIRAMTRRRNEYLPAMLQCGNLKLQRDTYTLAVAQKAVQLNRQEYQLMEWFMLNPEKDIAEVQLMERLEMESQLLETDCREWLQLYLSYLQKKAAALQANRTIIQGRAGCYRLVPCHD